MPVLALHGTSDHLTDPRGSAEFVARLRRPDATLRLYRGLFHDLVHEPERTVVQDDVVDFLRARTAAR